MSRLTVLPIFLLFFLFAHSQSTINSDIIFKAGIYKNFEEFRNNSPSIEFKDYLIEKKNRRYGILFLEGKIPFYKINIDRELGKSIGTVYGFSDGKNVFICPNYVQLGPNSLFSKVECIGGNYYCENLDYDVYRTAPAFNANTGFTGGSGSTAIVYIKRTIINIQDGSIIILSKDRFKSYISDDQELLSEFKKHINKSREIKRYLIKYFERKKIKTG